jgi:hypothetical protein
MLVLATAFAFILPPFSGPDETGHVAYVSALAQGHLPLIRMGVHTVADIPTGTSWLGQHPPLYYLLATPFYLAAGRNPLIGLYLLRLIAVGALAVTLILLRRMAVLLLPPDRVGTAAWLLAVHPTVVYVSSMANNEAMAMAFSISCVWAAVEARTSPIDAPRRKRSWLLMATLLGGLGLLTKLTAIDGVAAAAFAVGQDRSDRASWKNALLILVGAVGIWLPWGLYMHHVYGSFVPSPVHRPTFIGGVWAFLLYPKDFLGAVGIALPEFAVGLLCPYWLIAPFDFTRYPMLVVGWSVALGVLYTAWVRPGLRFVAVGFLALFSLVVGQVLFRDMTALLLLARYSPAATAMVTLLAADVYGSGSTSQRAGLRTVWGVLVAANIFYIFYFFLIGIPVLKR